MYTSVVVDSKSFSGGAGPGEKSMGQQVCSLRKVCNRTIAGVFLCDKGGALLSLSRRLSGFEEDGTDTDPRGSAGISILQPLRWGMKEKKCGKS